MGSTVQHVVRSAAEMRSQTSLCDTKAVVALLATLLVLLERHLKHICKGRLSISLTRGWHTPIENAALSVHVAVTPIKYNISKTRPKQVLKCLGLENVKT